MKSKKLKKKKNYSYDKVSVEKNTSDKLRDFCKKNNFFIQEVATVAIDEYLDRNDTSCKK